jgi:hypothetical protein
MVVVLVVGVIIPDKAVVAVLDTLLVLAVAAIQVAAQEQKLQAVAVQVQVADQVLLVQRAETAEQAEPLVNTLMV